MTIQGTSKLHTGGATRRKGQGNLTNDGRPAHQRLKPGLDQRPISHQVERVGNTKISLEAVMTKAEMMCRSFFQNLSS